MPERYCSRSHLLIAVAALTCCLLAMPFSSLAQNVTPLPQTLIFDWSNEVIFPAAVRFTVSIRSPVSQLVRAQLTVKPSGQPVVEVPVNITDSVIFDSVDSQLAVVWQIPDNLSLKAFEEVPYNWRVVTTSNMIGTRDGQFEFVDSRAIWTSDPDPAGRINLTVSGSDTNPERLRSSIASAYDFLSTSVGATPAFNFIVFPPSLRLDPCVPSRAGGFVLISDQSKTEVPCQPGRAESIYRASGYIPLSGRTANEREALVEALVEGFYEPLWRDKNVPRWFVSGLAQFYAPSNKLLLLEKVQVGARNGRLFSLDQMAAQPPDDPQQLDMWRAQSFSMIAYLANEIGVPGMLKLAKDIGSAPSFGEAFQTAAGPVRALLPALQNWIFKSAAAPAYELSPYPPTTPTPRSP